MDDLKNTVGIVSTNSCDFVRECFENLRSNKTIVLLRSRDDLEKIKKTNVSEVIEPISDYGWVKLPYSPGPAEQVAQISFTSGTEGAPKGVIIKHKAFNDVVTRLNEVMEVDATISEYIGIPVNFSFGFGRCRAVATAGGKFFIPENGFNPIEIRNMAGKGEINAISAVPSLWRMLLKVKSIFQDELKKIKWIEIGSQYMSSNEKEELKVLFPNAIIVQHYGLTEASRTTFLRIDQVDNENLESVGKAYGATKIKLSEDNKIMIQGPHVAESLLIGKGIIDNTDEDYWFETSDLGEIREGFLYYKGRADDLINCGGVKLSPDAIESELLKLLCIKDGIAIARVDDELMGNGVLVAVRKDIAIDDNDILIKLEEVLSKYGIKNKRVLNLLRCDDFPQTATGKIQRRFLREQFENSQSIKVIDKPLQEENENPSFGNNSEIDKISEIWKGILKLDYIDIHSNFYEHGGDSLTAITAIVEMEKNGVPDYIAKGMIQGKTISEVSQAATASEVNDANRKITMDDGHLMTAMNINIIRGLFVLCVIAGIFERLPVSFQLVLPYLSPIFSAGTPGFSVIYGVSAGYALFHIYNNNIDRFYRIQKHTLLILAVGIIIFAMVRSYSSFISQEAISFTDITNSFYSVLTYYLLITATIGFWFKVISKSSNQVMVCFLFSAASYFIYYFIAEPLGEIKAFGLMELIKLVLTAKYSYFSMASGTLLGISIGITLRRKNNDASKIFFQSGIAILLISFIFVDSAGRADMWLVWPKAIMIWDWLFYFSIVLLLIHFFTILIRKYNESGFILMFFYQMLSITGILAFPLFITHELVLPIKYILDYHFSLGNVALLVPMLFFIASAFYLYRKIYKITFCK